MVNLLGLMLRWCARHFMTFVVIVAILVAANFVRQELQEYTRTTDLTASLKSEQAGLVPFAERLSAGVAERVAAMEKAAVDALDQRIGENERAIADKRARRSEMPGLAGCVLKGATACDAYFSGLRLDAEILALAKESASLAAVRDRLKGAEDLNRLGIAHVAVYRALQRVEADLSQLIIDAPLRTRIPGLPEYAKLRELDAERAALRRKNEDLAARYRQQEDALRRLPTARPSAAQLAGEIVATLGGPLQAELNRLDEAKRDNWISKLSKPVSEVLPGALAILLGLMLAPLAIKSFWYFVIAPIASRRPPIRLLPEASGTIEGEPASASAATGGLPAAAGEAWRRAKISAVTHPITIDATEEVLVHPEYIQSSTMHGPKDTKWLLDRSYPLTSIVAGMYGLTRVRTAATETVVVSATADPFSEVGVVVLPADAAVVLQPRNLVGVVQKIEQPLRISRIWRIDSLNAWLTLQLRFLVFHGPAKLIVKGCRGVRLEQAGDGRAINQAATIGFSANLDYANTRCETFGSYLMGRQELFNDRFSGGPGAYLYEETPRFGTKSGVRRSIEGITDTFLKAFGI